MKQMLERRPMTDAFIRPDVAQFLNFLNNLPGPKTHESTPAEARAMMIAMRPVAEADTGELAVIRDLTIPGPAGDIPARLYDAHGDRTETGPIMVFFHGGGFVIGNIDTHEPYCAEAARQLDMPVVSIDYRLAPEHPFPAAPDDCEAAARWIAANIPSTGLVLSGDSAGGNLCIVTAMALRDAPAAVPVIAMNPIYPVVSEGQDWPSYTEFADGFLLSAASMVWFGEHYAATPGDRRGAPLHHDLSGLPPTSVMTASLDPLRDEGRAFVAALGDAGVPVRHYEAEGNIHALIGLRKAIPSSHDDVTRNLDDLKALLA
jgi:acetyl esterase